MGLGDAIAKVRKGAKKAGLNGALASLGAGLNSEVIPAPLRPAASRIASLIGAKAKREPRELPTLTPSMPTSHGTLGADEVCPFTGLRADGTLADAPSTEPAAAASPSDASGPQHAVQEPVAEVEQGAVEQGAVAQSAVAESAVEPSVEASAPVAEASAPALEEPPVEKASKAARAPKAASKPLAGKSTPPAARAAANEKSAPTEKGKEKVAGERSVAKNPARSASKPAAKQSNGKANQRKK